MTCPRCYAEFESDPSACPECGVQLIRNVSGVMKISAVLIAAGEQRGFYRSVQDVPEPLRSQLREITASSNSGTIVIADRAGKEQITQVMARKETTRERTAAPAAEAGEQADRRILGSSFLGLSGIFWAGLALALVASGVITAVFIVHW
jgi:hypothetical protein